MLKQYILAFPLIVIVLFDISLSEQSASRPKTRIDLTDLISIKNHQPILIAHRGGVVTPQSPENSLAAVKLAAQRGYALVEVDVRESKDGVPIAFHDDDLSKACGIEAQIEELTSKEIGSIQFKNSVERIVTLEEYLTLCDRLNLGIMLDIKTIGSDAFFGIIRDLIKKYNLDKSTVSIARPKELSEKTRRFLSDVAFLRLTDEEMKDIREGTAKSYKGKIWFDWPRYIDDETIKKYRQCDVLVIPSINVFHYPEEEHVKRAEKDIQRMKQAGVDAFQIDSVYDRFFDLSSINE